MCFKFLFIFKKLKTCFEYVRTDSKDLWLVFLSLLGIDLNMRSQYSTYSIDIL